MSTYTSLIRYKIISVWDSKKHFSATVLNSQIDLTAAIRQKCRIYSSSLGRYSYVARNTLIQNTEIGKFCSISEDCNIGMPSHPADMVSLSPVFLMGKNYLQTNFYNEKYEDCPKTIIGNDVWIGANVKIKSGIMIGDGAIIGAGAVVTKDVEPYSIVAGVPAKVIRYRFEKETICDLLNMEWWNWTDEKIKAKAGLFSLPSKLIDDWLSNKSLKSGMKIENTN